MKLRSFPRPLAHGLLAGTLASAWALLLPDLYRCEARILPDAGRGPETGRAGVWAPTAPPALPSLREEGPTVVYADILQSRRVAEALLAAPYEYGARPWRLGRPRRVRGTLLAYLGARDPERALGGFRRLLTVERRPRSGLLVVAAETRSPELSLQVVRNAVEALRAALADLAREEGRCRAREVGERLEEVRVRYGREAEAFRSFQEANRSWESSPSPNLRFRGAQLREQLALWRRILENLTLNREQALLEAGNDAQALLVLDPGSLPREKSRPHRAFLAVTAAALASALSWAVTNRSTVRDLFVAKETP